MGEFHRRVIVHGNDELPIAGREFEILKVPDGIPERRSHDHRPVGIGLPDNREGFPQVLVPQGWSECPRWLVQDLKEHAIRRGLIMCRQLPPRGQELVAPAFGILRHRVEFVQVQNHGQAVCQRVGHRPIHRGEPALGQDPVLFTARVTESMQIDAHGIEPRFTEQLEMPSLKPRIFARPPDRVVAEDIDAPAKPLILGKDIRDRIGAATDARPRASP